MSVVKVLIGSPWVPHGGPFPSVRALHDGVMPGALPWSTILLYRSSGASRVSTLVFTLLLLSSSAVSGEWRNGYWTAAGDDHGLRVLRCDATGRGHHGDSLLAGPGLACEGEGKVIVALDGPRLSLRWTVSGAPTVVRWSVPFRREGFYDADAHRLYLAPDVLDGRPFREVFRKFVGATGHARFVEEFKRVEPARPSSYGGGTTVAPLWLGPSHRLLMCGDRDLGFDLDVTWTGAERLECVVEDDRLTFRAQLSGPLSVRVEPEGTQSVPGGAFDPLRMRFFPDQELTQSLLLKPPGTR